MLSMIARISWLVCIVMIVLYIVLTLATKIIVKSREKRERKRASENS